MGERHLEQITKLPKRVVEKIEFTDSCWLWKGSTRPNGYGQIYDNGKIPSAHRFSWRHFYGEIPNGLYVLHKCDVRNCVNPDHLFLGTQQDNIRDMDRKGRRPASTGLKGEKCPWAKLTKDQVDDIRKLYSSGTSNKTHLAKMFGVHRTTIRRIVNFESWN